MARKQFILVAGVDWLQFKINFELQCLERIKILQVKHKGTPLRFVVFNFLTGEVKAIETSNSGKTSAPVLLKSFKPFKISDYKFPKNPVRDSVEFIGEVTGKMSILEVYKQVIAIGQDNPGELHEMSWFYQTENSDYPSFTAVSDHVYFDGKRTNIRSEQCLDPNLDIDFMSPNMSLADKALFQKAFAPKGVIWLWKAFKNEYVFDPGLRTAALTICEHIRNLQFIPEDNSVIDLDEYDSYVNYFFIRERLPLRLFNSNSIRVAHLYTFSILRYVFYTYLQRSAGFTLSNASGINIICNGNYSYTEIPLGASTDLPIVPKEIRPINKFYSDFFNLSLDEEDRGFLVITPGIKEPVLPTDEQVEKLRRARRRTIDALTKPATPTNPNLISPGIKPSGAQYFFVCGVDFTFSGINFYEKCLQRISEIAGHLKSMGAHAQFRIYDFQSGLVSYLDSRAMKSAFIDNSFEPITRTDFRKQTDLFGKEQFVFNGKERAMRMSTIYSDIIKLGFELPGSLMELSFVCHCNETGPITTNFKERFRSPGIDPLTNSTFDPDKISERFSADEGNQYFFDPSASADFSDGMMPGQLLTHFRQSWSYAPRIYCWFYNTSDSVLKLMKAIVNGPFHLKPIDPRKILPIKITTHQRLPELEEDEQIPIDIGGYTIEQAYDIIIKLINPDRSLRSMLEKISGQSSSPVAMKVRLGHLVYILGKILRSSYMTHLSRASGVDVYTGVPGVRTGFDSSAKGTFMHLNLSANKKYINFFYAFFGLEVNEMDADFYVMYPQTNKWDDENFPDKKYARE